MSFHHSRKEWLCHMEVGKKETACELTHEFHLGWSYYTLLKKKGTCKSLTSTKHIPSMVNDIQNKFKTKSKVA